MQSLINYRNYTTQELAKILVRNSIYYSRRHSYVMDGQQSPTTISLQLEKRIASGSLIDEIVIVAACYNNCENVTTILQANDYIRGEGIEAGWFKKWTCPILHNAPPLILLNDVFKGMETVLDSMPFALYESSQCKIIKDYYQFIESPMNRINYSELMEFLGYAPEQNRRRLEIISKNSPYMIAKYKNGNWAAWIEGDSLIPIFLSEQQAIAFLEQRNAILQPLEKLKVRYVQPVSRRNNQGVYILTDPSKTIDERIAWLQDELNFLTMKTMLQV